MIRARNRRNQLVYGRFEGGDSLSCAQKYNIWGRRLREVVTHPIGAPKGSLSAHAQKWHSDIDKELCVHHYCIDSFQMWIQEVLREAECVQAEV